MMRALRASLFFTVLIGCASTVAPPPPGDGGRDDATPTDAMTPLDGATPADVVGTELPDVPPVAPDPALRPVWPPSGSTVGSANPTLQWTAPSRPAEVVVELCRDRAMLRACRPALITRELRARVAGVPLDAGWWFWRVRVAGDLSPGRVWQLHVPRGDRSRAADSAWGVGSDVDGDGLGDVIVTMRDGATSSSDLWVRYGAPPGREPRSSSARLATTEPASDAAGAQVALLGDVDGDGFVDASATLTWRNGVRYELRVVLLRGGAEGLRAPTVVHAEDSPTYQRSIRTAGDLDHDGYADALLADSGQPTRLLRGGPMGLSAPVAMENAAVDVSSGAVDFDGDGAQDLLGVDAMARWYLARGSASGALRWETTPLTTRDRSAAMPLGDVDGDGRNDLAVWFSVPGFHGSGAQIEVRTAVTSATPTTTTVLNGNREEALSSIARLGDADGDGMDDLAFVSVTSYAGTRLQYVVWGAPSAPRSDSSPAANVLGGVSDADGDGLDDVVSLRLPAPSSTDTAYDLLLSFGGARTTTSRVATLLNGISRADSLSFVSW
jgi:FG-GAP-like repeat